MEENFIIHIVDFMEENKLSIASLNTLIRNEKKRRMIESESEYFKSFYSKITTHFSKKEIKALPLSYYTNSIKAFEIIHENEKISVENFIETLSKRVNSSKDIVKNSTLGDRPFFLWRGIREIFMNYDPRTLNNWENLSYEERLEELKRIEKMIS